MEPAELREVHVKLLHTPSNTGGDPSNQLARALYLPEGSTLKDWLKYSAGAALFPYLTVEDPEEFLKSAEKRLDAGPSCTVHFCLQQEGERFVDLKSGQDVTEILEKASRNIYEGDAPQKGDIFLATTYYYAADYVGWLDLSGYVYIGFPPPSPLYIMLPREEEEGFYFAPVTPGGVVSLPDRGERTVSVDQLGGPFPPYIYPASDVEHLDARMCSAAFVQHLDSAIEIRNNHRNDEYELLLQAFGIAPLIPAELPPSIIV